MIRHLLVTFGPPARVIHPEYPFWHMKNDGIWEVTTSDGYTYEPSRSPTKRMLLKHNAKGGFLPDIFSALQQDQELINLLAMRILSAHFPECLHNDILDAVGLLPGEFGSPPAAIPATRDPGFREKVLVTYGYRCAVCGFALRLYEKPVGLEAAHIKWRMANGPDIECNGIAFCSLHRKLFDLGCFTIGDASQLLLSDALNNASGDVAQTTGLLGKKLFLPSRQDHQPKEEYLAWHRKNVFKGDVMRSG